jgi:hypothetical protein
MFRATLPIIRRSNCFNIASGIELSVRDRPVCRFFLKLHTGRSLAESTVPDAVLKQLDLLMMNTVLLETCRGLQYKRFIQRNCA